MQGSSYLEDLDCLGTVLLVVEVGGGGLRELRMADCLVKAGKLEGFWYDDRDFGGREHWANSVKQGTSRDTNS